jgi:hypothetical protein
MELYSSEFNKRKNRFDQVLTRIRNKNSNFFLNADTASSVADLSDIKSYFSIEIAGDAVSLNFRKNVLLPERIQTEIQHNFNSIWEIQ